MGPLTTKMDEFDLSLVKMYSMNLVHRLFRGSSDKRRVQRYISTNPVVKIHFGCGENVLPLWLNTDTNLTRNEIFYLDVRRPLPLRDECADYAFHEHLLEHMNQKAGERFLQECFRILKPGGRLRVATPDVAFLFRLFASIKSRTEEDYVHWFAADHGIELTARPEVYLLNAYFYSWGHRFLYDKISLEEILRRIGFVDITWTKPGVSQDPNLANLEHHGDTMPPGFNEIETMVVEASRPKVSELGPNGAPLIRSGSTGGGLRAATR